MKKSFGLVALTLAAGACSQGTSDTALTSLDGEAGTTQPAQPGVELDGPEAVTLVSHPFAAKNGKAFRIDIDRATIKDCFASTGYSVTKLSGTNRYLVEIDPLVVPAVACSPQMMRDIETGVSIEIPKSTNDSFNYATVLVQNKLFGDAQTKVEAAGGDIERLPTSKAVFDQYRYYANSGDGFTIEVDKHIRKACYKPYDYSVAEVKTGGHIVETYLRPVPHFCNPDMVKDIQMGVDIRVAKSDRNYQYGSLLVGRAYDKTLPLKIKEDRKATKALQCNVYDADGRVAREMRIALFLNAGSSKATASIESRPEGASAWYLDYTEAQSTLVVEGDRASGILLEGLVSYPNYRATLDWKNDPRLKDRCWATLPNYDLELKQDPGTPAYSGTAMMYSSIVTDPAVVCDMPQFMPPPPPKPMFMKCGTEGDVL